MLKEMEYIYAVYQEKSFSKAAKKLFVSQPALSAIVKKVEERLQTVLFNRSSKPLTLTEAGEHYIEAAKKIIDTYKDMESEIFKLTQKDAPIMINLGSSAFFCTYILPSYLEQFRKLRPDVIVRLHEGDAIMLDTFLQQDRIDFIVDVQSLLHPNRTSFSWKKENIILAVPHEYPINDKLKSYQYTFSEIKHNAHLAPTSKEVDLALFKDAPFIILNSGNDMYLRSVEMCKRAGFTPNVNIYTDQMLTSYNQARSGHGIAFVRDSIPAYADSTDKLLFYKLADPTAKRTINIITKTDRVLSPWAQSFLSEVMGCFIGASEDNNVV